jgi:hypothetical protein
VYSVCISTVDVDVNGVVGSRWREKCRETDLKRAQGGRRGIEKLGLQHQLDDLFVLYYALGRGESIKKVLGILNVKRYR